jgi:hypothetical protein
MKTIRDAREFCVTDPYICVESILIGEVVKELFKSGRFYSREIFLSSKKYIIHRNQNSIYSVVNLELFYIKKLVLDKKGK